MTSGTNKDEAEQHPFTLLGFVIELNDEHKLIGLLIWPDSSSHLDTRGLNNITSVRTHAPNFTEPRRSVTVSENKTARVHVHFGFVTRVLGQPAGLSKTCLYAGVNVSN